MSFHTVPWAWSVDGITPTQKLVLMGLASYADERNSCFPGQQLLADRAGVSTRTVRRALDDLEDKGLIQREQRRDNRGMRTSDRYVLNVSRKQVDILAASESHRTSETTSPDIDDSLTGHPCPGNYPENSKSELPVTPIVPTFDDFYSIYPLKKSKDAARRAWDKAIKRESPDVIMAGVRRFVADPNIPDKQFMKHPSTWLNGGCWADEPEAPRNNTMSPLERNMQAFNDIYGGGELAGSGSIQALDAGVR
ncbi:helix-turn-helix domain-containing protein [Gulosibacter molinativorax]|uniref:HTH domain-containing protein n=1 Tax=Gulosibacter molinativorax TaxID=256821 RepID=A0ABT7C999_9MICO|nr:helix-turn-helix domain-containing protein [Gulosibacter molinativorax]MDJ1371767.1 HTH domain-containing protein [Gulosibacter molinativorax]QUY60863.1 Hypotetical protein [Gulosibacter molinativorax]